MPSNEKPNVTPEPSVNQLVIDFAQLVQGVQQHGCGLEAQLESWYRFLIQPDPYESVQLSSDHPPFLFTLRSSAVAADTDTTNQ